MRQKTALWSGLLVITAGLIVGATLLGHSPSEQDPPAPTSDSSPSSPPHTTSTQVVKPMRRDLQRTFTIPATVAPWQQATLYSRVAGYLKWIGVDKGDEVRQGQVLAVVDAPEIAQQYKEAEAEYEIRRVTYERYANVWRETPNVIAKQDVDVAAAEAKAARHIRDTRKVMLDYTKVYAPFNGRITARFLDPGALIASGTTSTSQGAALLTVMEVKRLRVYASAPQEVSFRMKRGLPVLLKVKEVPGIERKATISRTTGVLDPATRTLLIEIDIDNEDERFQPGMFVTATFYLEDHPNALVLPPSAILTKTGGTRTVLIVAKGQVVEVPVKTGLDDGVWVEVTDGLTGEEDVIVTGQRDLAVGQAVKALPYALPTGTPSSQKL